MSSGLCGKRVSNFDVAFPYLGSRTQSDDKVAGTRGFGLPKQTHTGDIVQSVSFAVVAFGAGASSIRPGITAAFGTRDDMVDGEIALAENLAFDQGAQLDPAVDASVIVAHQHTLAAPVRFSARYINVRLKRDDRRDRKPGADRVQVLTCLFYRNRFAGQHKIDSTLHRNDGKRLPCAAIQKQNAELQNI